MPEEQIGVTGHGGPGEAEQIDDAAGGAEGEPSSGGGAMQPMIVFFSQ